MNKDLLKISNALEDEVLITKSLSEIMEILHTAFCGYAQTELNFKNIQDATWLICNISKRNAEKLFEISNDVFDAFKNLSENKSE
ncbi:MAG: hypothetical protein K2G04_00385 [Oscillospiraceae bacterium]|nr:hypothetical protein [Oscillospiraceae bacterium]